MASQAPRISRACANKLGPAFQSSSRVQSSRRRFNASSLQYLAKDLGKGTDNVEENKSNVLDKKGEKNNPQSTTSTIAQKENDQGESASSAVDQKDDGNSRKKAMMDFPEANDPAIGNQDERGGKY